MGVTDGGKTHTKESSEEMGSWLRDRARDGGRESPSHGRSLQDVSRSLEEKGKVFGYVSSHANPDSSCNQCFQGSRTEDSTRPLLLALDKQTYFSGSLQRRH